MPRRSEILLACPVATAQAETPQHLIFPPYYFPFTEEEREEGEYKPKHTSFPCAILCLPRRSGNTFFSPEDFS